MNPTASTRRGFLKSAAAVASVPFILPSGIWSAPVKPNDKIAVGFIGMGRRAGGLVNSFMGQERVAAVAVSDCDTTRRNASKAQVDKKNGNTDCAAYNDYRDLLARGDLDAVCIATPDHWHAIQILDSMDAGLDVYCEKPLVHNIHEAIRVMQAVKTSGKVLQTGSQQRSSREFRVACELVRNGAIGRIKRIDVNFGGPGIPCDLPGEAMEPGLDWDMWLGPAPMRPYNEILSPRGVHNHFPRWRSYREYGGGMVTDWGAHHVDIVQWGLNQDNGGPIAAVPPSEAGAENGAQLIYEGDIPVYHGRGIGIHFFGSEGEVQVARGRFALAYQGKTVAQRLGNGENLGQALDIAEREFLQSPSDRLYRSPGHTEDFLRCMETRRKPITSEIVGCRSIIACHLMNLAYYHGQRIEWDPVQLNFRGGTGKAEWLTREYRGDWIVS